MNIINIELESDSYYLRTSDVEPDLDGTSLKIYNGNNHKYGNKSCVVWNIVVHNDEHLTSVVCAWHCRHSGSQFWRHYRDGKQVVWRSLSEADRMLILDAYTDHVPGWCNRPGKLERDYIRGKELSRVEIDEQGTLYGYKILKLGNDGLYHSPARVSNFAAWYNGELTADQEPSADNPYGIYCVKSRKNHALDQYNGRLVKLALSGTIVEGETGFRAQRAQIVEEL